MSGRSSGPKARSWTRIDPWKPRVWIVALVLLAVTVGIPAVDAAGTAADEPGGSEGPDRPDCDEGNRSADAGTNAAEFPGPVPRGTVAPPGDPRRARRQCDGGWTVDEGDVRGGPVDPSPDGVFGGDEREWLSGTDSPPYSTVVRLTTAAGVAESGLCSGVLVDEYHALTAAHCVNTSFGNISPSDLRIYPGARNVSDNGVAPYGVVGVSEYHVFERYLQNDDPGYDVALVTLDRNVGEYAGAMAIYEPSGQDDEIYFRDDLNLTGYPGDRQEYNDGVKRFTMWTDADRGTDTGPEQHAYRIDATDGQSGSAVWTYHEGSLTVLSIHASVPGVFTNNNSGPRLSGNKVDRIRTWMGRDSTPEDRPDLAVTERFLDEHNESPTLALPSNATPGSRVSASVGVRNAGTAPTGCFEVSLYASTDEIIGNGSDYSLGSETVCSLSPFATRTVRVRGRLPPGIEVGETYRVGWVADDGDAISEFGEGDGKPGAGNARVHAGDRLFVVPPEPSDPSPGNGTIASEDVRLAWAGSDRNVTYDVYLEAGDRSPDRPVAEGLSDPRFAPGLDPGRQYYWRVVANGPNGSTSTGPVWSFTTNGTFAATGAAAAVSGTNGTVTLSYDVVGTTRAGTFYKIFPANPPEYGAEPGFFAGPVETGVPGAVTRTVPLSGAFDGDGNGLVPGERYVFEAYVANRNGSGFTTTLGRFTTPSGPLDVELTGTAINGSAVRLTANVTGFGGTDAVGSYYAYRRVGGSNASFVGGPDWDRPNRNERTIITGLAPNSTYRFTITVDNGDGDTVRETVAVTTRSE